MAFRTQIILLYVLLWIAIVQAARECSNPSVRREWRTLSKNERADWINAVKCLNKLPHDPALTPSLDPAVSLIPPVNTSTSFWDDISYIHMDLNFMIHFTGFFLPWHRAFVQGVENAMKTKCGYKGAHPYWDWTQDAPDFYNATIFDDDPASGLGRWGDPANDYQIATGGFGKDFIVSYPAPHNIRRNFTLQPFFGSTTALQPDLYINTTFAKENTDYVINSFVGNFIRFQGYLEGILGPHPSPHIILGGDMRGFCPGSLSPPECVPGSKWSPNDPLFFLHHAMVDKVWYDWQNKHPANYYAFQGGSISQNNGTGSALFPTFPNGSPPNLDFSSALHFDGLLWDNLTIWDVMDTRNKLCYVYR